MLGVVPLICFVRDDASEHRVITKRLFALAHTQMRRLGDTVKHLYWDGAEYLDICDPEPFRLEEMAASLGFVEGAFDEDSSYHARNTADLHRCGNITMIRRPADSDNVVYMFILEGENNIVIGLY